MIDIEIQSWFFYLCKICNIIFICFCELYGVKKLLSGADLLLSTKVIVFTMMICALIGSII